MANLNLTAAHTYTGLGTVETLFTIEQPNGYSRAENPHKLTNLTLDDLRKLSALISNALADTSTTHNAVSVRAYNSRRK